MMKLKVFAALVCALSFLTSCGYNEFEGVYGKKESLRIVNKNENEVHQVYLTKWTHPMFYILGGMGSNYEVEVEDTSLVSYTICSKLIEKLSFLNVNKIPSRIYLQGKKLGRTTVSITDTDVNQTVHLQVEITGAYSAITILESDVEGYEEDMLLAFRVDGGCDYRILRQEGGEYITTEVGKYKFGEPRKANCVLTLTCGENETLWIITDADNNKAGSSYYISDVMLGLKLPNQVLTKIWDPNPVYPTEFRFTDIVNPERSFITGPADAIIPDRF